MNELPEDGIGQPSREEMLSALFANMVIQQTNMALMFLGKVPHPETGQTFQDIDSAKMFIDQLEMLAVKTKGNLDRREEGLLKQSLTALRMAFVEEIGGGAEPPPASETSAAPAAPTPPPEAKQPAEPSPIVKPAEEQESRKKFSKKY